MSKTILCELIGQTNQDHSYGTSQRGVGFNGDTRYYYRLKLKTPDFDGVKTSISFNMFIRNDNYSLAVFHYALCTSDENFKMYAGDKSTTIPNDHYQIAAGVFRCEDIDNGGRIVTLTISADTLSKNINPQTEYYLYLWSYKNTSDRIYESYALVGSLEKNSASVEYTPKYTVKFISNGHGSDPDVMSVAEGDSITLPTLTADGYAFKGWSTDPNAASGITGTYTPTATVTLYAVWKKIHIVTYDANGRGTAPAADNVVDGDIITLPTITDKGYNFLGWATSPDAKEGINGEYAPTASVTLYAVWRQKGSIVGYNDGGTCVKCRVRVRINGNVYPCRVYYRSNGTAVEV